MIEIVESLVKKYTVARVYTKGMIIERRFT